MTTLSWPDSVPCVVHSKFWIAPDQFLAVGSAGGDVYAAPRNDGTKWRADLTITRHWGPAVAPFDAFLVSLQSADVLVPDARQVTRGSLAGSPAIVGGAAGGNQVTLSGFTPNAVNVLMAGDRIQTSVGRMHMVLADCTASVDGVVVATVAPALRVNATVGTLVANGCTLLMRCLSGWGNPTTAPLVTTWNLSFVERF